MLSIFEYDFMVRAFAAGVVTAVIAPVIGMFLVTRRYSFMADTLAHVSLAGVGAGLLLGTEPIFASMAASVAAALAVEQLRMRRRILGDSILALFLSGGLAVAVLLLSLSRGRGANLSSLLFGSVVTVSALDVAVVAVLGLLVLLVVTMLYRGLFAVAFDEQLAEVGGLPTGMLNRVFVVLAAVTVALTMRVVGILLVGALMVIPVITAMQYGKGFRATMALSVLFSLFAVVSGLLASFLLNLASGGTIVLVAILLFALSSLAARR